MNEKKLKALVFEVFSIEKYLYNQTKKEIDYVIENNIKDKKYIESLLDQLLNLLMIDTSSEFYRLCNYYKSIKVENEEESKEYEENAKEYIKIYKMYKEDTNE